MPPIQKSLRYAHADGHTDVCYSEDGKHILTSGHDGEVRIWAGIEDDDNQTICVAEEMANAVAQRGSRMFVATDDNLVQAYTYPGSKRDGVITRFTAPVTDISVSNSGKFLAAGSADMEIHVTSLQESSQDIVFTDHTAPLIGVAVDPKDKFVVSSSCDGTIQVWDLDQRKSVKSWDCVPKANSFFLAPVLARAAWQPTDRNYLAVPQNKEVRLYEHTTWSQVAVLTSSGCSEPFSLLSFSPCGKYLAAVSGGMICVWDVNLHAQVHCFSHERGYKVCALTWNPTKGDEIAYCDVRGQLGTIENVLPEKGSSGLSGEEKSSIKRTEKNANDLNALKDLEGLGFDDDDDDDGDNVISLEKIKNETMNFGNDDDKGSGILDDDVQSVVSGSTRIGFKVNAQPTFQPSSTPESLQHRFMVWNSVGIIRCVNNEDENSIDVRFHDTAVHHAILLNNLLGHTLAALSEQAVVLACPALDDAPSKVQCVVLNAWDGTREWMTSLPEGESAVATATGSGWLAVATDAHFLRIICLAGTQRQILSLPGAPVCLTGFKEKLLVVYHGGVGLPDEQNLWYQLFTISEEGPISSGPTQRLPISPGSTLKWAGFTDERSPCTLDSSDIVRLLPARTHTWMPICDTKDHAKGKSDHFFIVGVSERFQNLRAVLCRGAYYPPTAPLPIVAELPLQLPFCEKDTEKSKLEESLWRSQLMLCSMKAVIDISNNDDDLLTAEQCKGEAEKIIKESLIKLFALSTRGGLEMRAIELSRLMPSAQVAELAAKYAGKSGRSLLAERVSNIVSSKKDKEEMKAYIPRARSPDMFASQSQSQGRSNYDVDAGNMEDGFSTQEADKENEQEKENLLLAAKRKRAALEAQAVEIKPAVLLNSQKKLNPFKKSAVLSTEARGLDRLSSPYSSPQEIQKKNIATLSKNNVSGQALSKPQAKQMTLFGKKLEPGKGEEKKKVLPFTSWFAKEKAALQDEFPEMDTAELTKQGMKRYKENKEKVQEDSSTQETEEELPSAKKQKMEATAATVQDTSESDAAEAEEAAAMLAAASEAMDMEDDSFGTGIQNSEEMPVSSDKKGNGKSGIGKLKAFAFSSKT